MRFAGRPPALTQRCPIRRAAAALLLRTAAEQHQPAAEQADNQRRAGEPIHTLTPLAVHAVRVRDEQAGVERVALALVQRCAQL